MKIEYIIAIILSYLFGSIPWGLVIGKVFYHIDIRDYGSGNPGGTNAARVLGKWVGFLVIFLDAAKALIAMTVVHYCGLNIEEYCGLAVCIGHCFPIFAQFKGGKAVASSYGYLLGLALFKTNKLLFTFVLPVIIFFIILLISKMVSLSSMLSLVAASIINLLIDKKIGILVSLLTLFVIYRHKDNIKRIINGTENKIKSS